MEKPILLYVIIAIVILHFLAAVIFLIYKTTRKK